jgi:hypothetical protein
VDIDAGIVFAGLIIFAIVARLLWAFIRGVLEGLEDTGSAKLGESELADLMRKHSSPSKSASAPSGPKLKGKPQPLDSVPEDLSFPRMPARSSNRLQGEAKPPGSVPKQHSPPRAPAGAPSGSQRETVRQPREPAVAEQCVFISYRREDSSDVTGRIYDRLVSEFGRDSVYKDVDTIPLGKDFRIELEGALSNAAVVLAVIGPKWMREESETGSGRLQDPDDYVGMELSVALKRKVPVIPVLVSGGTLPAEADLPRNIADLVYRNAIKVRPDPDFHNDVNRLIAGIREHLPQASRHRNVFSNWRRH